MQNEKELEQELARLREQVEQLTADRDFWAFAYKVADYHLKQEEAATLSRSKTRREPLKE
ncbi:MULTISPECIES: hypothetical protein [unclassified Leclercia]|uniref:Uncharacterized protein n=1 Tax=Leclercia barmai TaxID=2785629 RepID=A0ABS7S1I8_9ENTR|nr:MULTISPECIES: hypothetical protein [unclassified Leclercia]MBZ0059599.1 hypothetical protein [Leclercia sp. EMC7]MCM5697268.1 hypothetical protein [Leclercia sp. LTM01]MCM5702136.1 hypothetical protein [Leclercia sp. LTM14]